MKINVKLSTVFRSSDIYLRISKMAARNEGETKKFVFDEKGTKPWPTSTGNAKESK